MRPLPRLCTPLEAPDERNPLPSPRLFLGMAAAVPLSMTGALTIYNQRSHYLMTTQYAGP